MCQRPNNVIEIKALHNREHVFSDRRDAGKQLAQLLTKWRDSDAVVLAIPAGGVPVAAGLAESLHLPMDVLVVSKITLPWNTEAGFGAVSANGDVRINEALVTQAQLDKTEVDAGITRTREKVQRREKHFHKFTKKIPVRNKEIILVDDGLASGFTMQVAIESLRNRQAGHIIVAVPTGHSSSVKRIAEDCDQLYCANIREGFNYAVANAFDNWYDVSEEEVTKLLQQRAT